MTLSIPTRLLSCIALVATLVPMGVGGQSWKSVNAVGYGGAGAAVAVALIDAEDCTGEGLVGCVLLEIPLKIGAGWAAGMTVGTMIGERADRSLAAGEPLGDLHVAAVAGGTVLAGATAGVVAGTLVAITGSPIDFQDLASILSIAGAGAGLAYLDANWNQLTGGSPEAVRLTPAFSPERGAGLVATVRF